MKKCKKCSEIFEPKKGLVNYCSLKCRNSRTWSEHDKLKKSETAKKSENVFCANKKIGLNRVLTRLDKNCGFCGKIMQLVPSSKNRIFCSNECFHKSEKNRTNGGCRKGSGVGKKGWYRGYWCDSSWELAWVIYHLEHDIIFTRNTEGFVYFFNSKKHNYFPDFIIDNVYYEIKGYKTEQTNEKIKQFKGELKIIGKEEIKEFIKYVVEKYGSEFIKLYEDNPYNKLTKVCPICGGLCKEKNIVCSRKCSGKLVKKYATVDKSE